MGILDKITSQSPKSTNEGFIDTIIGKLIDNLPPETLQHIHFIAETVRGFDERLTNIQNQLAAIDTALEERDIRTYAALNGMQTTEHSPSVGKGNGTDDNS